MSQFHGFCNLRCNTVCIYTVDNGRRQAWKFIRTEFLILSLIREKQYHLASPLLQTGLESSNVTQRMIGRFLIDSQDSNDKISPAAGLQQALLRILRLIETSLGLGLLSLVEPGHLTLMQLMACMSKNPAEFYRMIPGSVTQDAPADLVIFGEKEHWTVDHFASKASNSPFKGWELPGKIHYTICAGKIVYQD